MDVPHRPRRCYWPSHDIILANTAHASFRFGLVDPSGLWGLCLAHRLLTPHVSTHAEKAAVSSDCNIRIWHKSGPGQPHVRPNIHGQL